MIKARAEDSAVYLRGLLCSPAQELYTVTVGYSDHGCTVRLFTTKAGEIYEITNAVARVLGNRVTTKGAMMFRGKGVSPADQIARTLEWKLRGDETKQALKGRAL